MLLDTDEDAVPADDAAPEPPLILPAELASALQGVSLAELAEVRHTSPSLAPHKSTMPRRGQVVSEETWNTRLDGAQRDALRALLPTPDEGADAVLASLFAGKSLSLAPPPLELFRRQLEAGDLTTEGAQRAQRLELSRRREFVARGGLHTAAGPQSN